MALDARFTGSSQTNKEKMTIGYMTNGIHGEGGKGGYHTNLWKGIQDAVRANGANLICFLGGSPHISPHFEYEYQRNQVFNLISEENIDGLLIGSTLEVTFGIANVEKVCARLPHLPIISIGNPISTYPWIGIDNRIGEKVLVDHLIEVHGCRRIAFLCGPEASQDAKVRFEAYRESLAEHGIPMDPNLIFQGNFIRTTGSEAAHRLLNEIRRPVDAVVAANDGMALGFITALQDRGIQVPNDIAVVGFDDIPDAQTSFPPLTTVTQPVYEFGKKSVEVLFNELCGGVSTGQTMLPTRLMIRNSCGCSLLRHSQKALIQTPIPPAPVDLNSARWVLIETMVDSLACSASHREQARQQAIRLVDVLEAVLAEGNPDSDKLNELTQIMTANVQESPLLPWHRAVTVFYQYRSASFPDQQCSAPTAVVWHSILQISSEIAWLSQSFQTMREQYFEDIQIEHFRAASQALSTTFYLPELMETAYRMLPYLGIKGCWIGLFEGSGEGKQLARLILAYNENGRIQLPDPQQVYPASQLFPHDLMDRDRPFEVIVSSLFFGDTIFGLMGFEMDHPDHRIIEMVTSQISTALHGTKVVNELQRIQAEFRRQANTDPLTGIYNRRMLYTLAEPVFDLAVRHELPLSLAMLDLDNFKHVNDLYGHIVGDQVLRTLCTFVQSQTRGTDIFGRFGGEEFLIILPETTLEGAFVLVERIRKSIEAHPIMIGDVQIPLTISAGVAALFHHQDKNTENLIDRADLALYKAKHAGKNCVST